MILLSPYSLCCHHVDPTTTRLYENLPVEFNLRIIEEKMNDNNIFDVV